MDTNIPFFRTEYNYNRDEVSRETGLRCGDASRTRQEFAQDADINTIVERFGIGHEMPINTKPPLSGDFTDLPDYKAALDMVRAADDLFGTLPAKIRSRFNNDPAQYIAFFEDPDNMDEAIKLGLAKAPPAVQDAPSPIVETKTG